MHKPNNITNVAKHNLVSIPFGLTQGSVVISGFVGLQKSLDFHNFPFLKHTVNSKCYQTRNKQRRFKGCCLVVLMDLGLTHMIFEELQPLIVFTFGFPHFHQRLDLESQMLYLW